MYGGDAAPSALGFSWTVVAPGTKSWGLGASDEPIRCEVTGTMLGSLHVRVYNSHDLRRIDDEGKPTGCTGTALDLAVTVLDVGAPAQVADVAKRLTDGTIALSWAVPATDVNGVQYAALADVVQVAGYDYRYRTPGAANWTEGDTTESSVSITVPEESYEVQVRATSREGIRAWSQVVGVGRRAGPPLDLAATAEDGQMTLAWEPPSSDGGAPITDYEYQVDGDGDWKSAGTDLSEVVTGLANGRSTASMCAPSTR